MKSKKLALPMIILVIAILAMAVLGIVSNIAKKPTITEMDFPFSITYELNGETVKVDAVYAVSYVGNGGYVKATTRIYEGEVISETEGADTSFVISQTDADYITIYTRIQADYLMGDPAYDYYDDAPFEPILAYCNMESGETIEGQDLSDYGAKIISWDYPQPIENSFVFSHIAHLSGADVLPFLLTAALAAVSMFIFVRKEKSFTKLPANTISILLNIVIALTLLPFATIFAVFCDINGSSGELSHQMCYLLPTVTMLGLAASIGLRRRACSKGSIYVQLIGPFYFAILLILLMAL